MVETISIQDLCLEDKKILLGELGYSTDGNFVLDKNDKPLIDKYTNEPIKVNNMVVLPGSAVVLDDNPLSITSFLEDHPDVSLF